MTNHNGPDVNILDYMYRDKVKHYDSLIDEIRKDITQVLSIVSKIVKVELYRF